jgi:ribosome-associated toxin RatA of RatAB toxin-antitoxin module
MALVPTLTITDTTTFSDIINFSVTDSLTVKAPSQALSTIIAGTGGADAIIVAASTDVVYLFVRHTGTTDGSTGTAHQLDVEFTTHEGIARLKANEWLFMPCSHAAADVGIQLQTTSGSIQAEFAYWTSST